MCVFVSQRSQHCVPPSVSLWGLIIDYSQGTAPGIWQSVHTHTVILCVATSTDILDLYFFSLHMDAHTDSQTYTHSQRFLPPFFSDYIQHPGSTDRAGTNIPLLYQCKLQELNNRRETLVKKFKRCGSDTQPSLLLSAPISRHEYRPCVLLGEERATVVATQTHKYAPTHTFICWSKYFTLPGSSPHDHSTQFSPLTHEHTQ